MKTSVKAHSRSRKGKGNSSVKQHYRSRAGKSVKHTKGAKSVDTFMETKKDANRNRSNENLVARAILSMDKSQRKAPVGVLRQALQGKAPLKMSSARKKGVKQNYYNKGRGAEI